MQNEKRVLLVSNSFPEEDSTGSEQRTANFYGALIEKYAADLIVIKEDKLFYSAGQATRESAFQRVAQDVTRETRYLPKGIRTIVSDLLIYRGINPNNTNLLDRLLPGIIENAGYEFIICRYLHNYMCTGLFKAKYKTGKVFLDLDDVPWKMIVAEQNINKEAALKEMVKRISRFLIRQYSVYYIRRAKKVIVSNPNDLQGVPHPNKYCVPNIPKRYPFLPTVEDFDSNTILFVANLKYDPNIQGLYYFVTRIWSLIVEDFDDLVLDVVGSFNSGDQRIAEISGVRGIRLSGFVENLEQHYRKAHFAIAPVYWGGGTKVKVIEALSFTRTVVATRYAINGFEQTLHDGESVFVADNDQVFIDRCVTLLRNTELCKKMGMKGKEIVDKHFSVHSFRENLELVIN